MEGDGLKETWTVDAILEAWGLRQTGSIKNPLKVSTQGKSGADFEAQAAVYVETTPGFWRARPVLRWVYFEGKDVRMFRPRLPGESLIKAVHRLGWSDLWGGVNEHAMGEIILGEFRVALQTRIDSQGGWNPIPPVPERDSKDVADEMNAKFSISA